MEGEAACKCEDAGQLTRNTVRITASGKERHYIGYALGLFQRGELGFRLTLLPAFFPCALLTHKGVWRRSGKHCSAVGHGLGHQQVHRSRRDTQAARRRPAPVEPHTVRPS